MEKKEVIKFKGHKLQPMIDNEQIIVPTFRDLPANYRLKFPKVGTQIAKVSLNNSYLKLITHIQQVERVFKKPRNSNITELFGDSDDEPKVVKTKSKSKKRRKREPTPEPSENEVSPDESEQEIISDEEDDSED